MSKFKNWCKKPITRGDYLKLCGVALGVSTLYYVALLGWTDQCGRQTLKKGGIF